MINRKIVSGVLALAAIASVPGAQGQVAGTPVVIEDDTDPALLQADGDPEPAPSPTPTPETQPTPTPDPSPQPGPTLMVAHETAATPGRDLTAGYARQADRPQSGQAHGARPICLGNPAPCVRVNGAVGTEFWVVNYNTFMSWGRPGETAKQKIDRASSYLLANFPVFTLADGEFVPRINKARTDYLILPFCREKVAYKKRWQGRLPDNGETPVRIRC